MKEEEAAEHDLDLSNVKSECVRLWFLRAAGIGRVSTTSTSHKILLYVVLKCGMSCVIQFLQGGTPPFGRK